MIHSSSLTEIQVIFYLIIGILPITEIGTLRPNLSQKKVQGKIFKLLPGDCYVRSLLHGVICVTKCQHPPNCFSYCSYSFFFLFSPGHLSANCAQLLKRNCQ